MAVPEGRSGPGCRTQRWARVPTSCYRLRSSLPLAPGRTLAQYRITAAIGAGGMGEVYRATDTKLGREVAIKVLPAELAQDPERLARFEREAKLLASLNHPNIAHVYGFESATLDDGSPLTSWRWSWSKARTSPSG